MRVKVGLVTGIVLLGSTVVRAQLSETPEQCDQRFGAHSIQRGPSSCWTCSREYTHDNLLITVRFLSYTIGTTNAGWIECVPNASVTNSAARRDAFRLAVSPKWDLMEEAPVTPAMDATEAARVKASNAFIGQTRKAILAATGWRKAVCWSTPSAYAADDGKTVIIFSGTALARLRTAPVHSAP